MLPWSDLGRPLTLRNRRDGDEGEARITSPPVRHPHDAENTARIGDKAKPLAAYRRRLCCLGRQPALIPVVPAVPIMIVVMIRVIGVVMTLMVGVVPAVPRCGWNRAADYDCANNAQRCSNCRQGSHDAFLHLVFSSFG